MPLYRVSLNGVTRWYYLRTRFPFPSHIALQQPETTQDMEAVGSSRFFLDTASNTLFKLVADKHAVHREPFRWWIRDILEKRLLGGFDGLKEWQSNARIRQAGLRAIECRGVGVALNPFNPLGSLLAMEHLDEGESGADYFRRESEEARLAFLQSMCDDAVALIHHGYYHRDFHYGNLLLDDAGEIVWIDTHVKRLPQDAHQRRQTIIAMLSPTKLQGERYRAFAEAYLIRQLAL
ncbi:hypothetical protein [Chromohalobacter sp. HP20-39]|uniref:hypothetical protein n=1 Tax=Chromohalobacter sp. HP20-39 TaxID=3079306 RepID=UPI00294AEFAB|nr:hypothetical protein [Chromohalobacter sp. HP20-39]MDV6320066.1 hypothetical protein [Chromohalobacter sp. HP20-39]